MLNSSKLLFLSIGVLLAILMSSCTYDKTVVTLGSAFDNTWSFSNGSGYDFDANYVEIKNGKAQLKELDLEHSGADFNNGTHVGSHTINNNLSLLKFNFNQTNVNAINLPTSSNLIANWRFNGDLEDSTSNRGDLIQGFNATLSETDGNGILTLDGSQDFLRADNSDGQFNLGDQFYTISLWFNSNGVSAAEMLLGHAGISTGWSMYLNSTGQLCFFFKRGDTSTNSRCSSTTSLDDGNWHHGVVRVYASTIDTNHTIEVFIDNEFSNDALIVTGVFQPDTSGIDLCIGCRNLSSGGSSQNNFNGKIDEVSFVEGYLKDSQVALIFENQKNLFFSNELSPDWTPKYDNIVGYWKMDGNWQDSSENGNHGVASGDAGFSNIVKIGSHSGEFLTPNDTVAIADNNQLDLDENLSFSSWFYFVNYGAYYALNPISKQTSTSNSNLNVYYFGNHAGANPSQEGILQVYANNGGSWGSISAGYKVTLNSWVHVGFSYDRVTGGQLFINGEPVGIKRGGGLLAVNSENLCFGTPCFTSGLGDYLIDDFALWDTELRPSDFKLVYNRQKQKYAGHYDSQVIDLGSSTSNWPDLSWSTSLPFGKELVGDFDNDGNPDGETSSDYSLILSNLQNALVGYWPLNVSTLNSGPSGSDFIDFSGYDNHGNEFGGLMQGLEGKLLNSPIFDGTDDYIEVPDSIELSLVSDFTISTWIKLGSPNFTKTIVGKTDVNIPSPFEFNINGQIPRLLIGDGTSFCNVDSTVGVDINVWKHLLVKKSGTTISHYIDGQFINSNTCLITPVDADKTMRIGGRDDLITPFNGSIDELGIWSRAISDIEVQQLYRRGANRIKFQVKSCVDSSCICKSYNPAPLGNETDCDGDGILNAADNDDIHKSEFIGPGGDGTTYYSELFNRPTTEITFDCALNTTDSNPGVCVGDEITLAGGPKPTGPEFLQTDYTQFVSPSANQYAQYRVYMEADDNTACDGEPCLPELTSVNLNPSGITKYSGGLREIRPKAPITFNQLRNINITADACVTFRLARSGTDYYHDGSAWSPATIAAHRSTESELENNILQFGSQFGPGELEVIAYLETDSDQLTPCGVDEIDVNYK